MTTAPPGWYQDPADPHLQRWWDGAAWSPITQPATPTTPQLAPAIPAMSASPAAPRFGAAVASGGKDIFHLTNQEKLVEPLLLAWVLLVMVGGAAVLNPPTSISTFILALAAWGVSLSFWVPSLLLPFGLQARGRGLRVAIVSPRGLRACLLTFRAIIAAGLAVAALSLCLFSPVLGGLAVAGLGVYALTKPWRIDAGATDLPEGATVAPHRTPPPPAAPPQAGQTGILVTTHYARGISAETGMSTGRVADPQVSVDGQATTVAFTTAFIPVSPGEHEVEIWSGAIQLLGVGIVSVTVPVDAVGRAKKRVTVAPGEIVEISWRYPWLNFLPGKFTVTHPQTH